MYEGSRISRVMQIISGIGIGFLTLLMIIASLILFSGLILSPTPFNFDKHFNPLICAIIFLPLGIVGQVISYRLITARGTIKGAGLLSAKEYILLGLVFVALSILCLIAKISELSLKHILISLAPLIMTYLCFVAARFREGFKDVPTWQNKR